LKAVLGTALVGPRVFLCDGGKVDEKTVQEYIETQKWKEDDQGFKITAPTEP
jgi:hypothetical protein